MVSLNPLIKAQKWVNKKITNFTFVKVCLIAVLAVYLPLVIIGVILAMIFDPDSYFIWTNWISDLGSFNHTPFPYLYDLACIVAGILCIPVTFYLEKILAPIPETEEELRRMRAPRVNYRLASFGLFFGLIGNIGYIFVGIFSEDRAFPFSIAGFDADLHGLFSYITFAGFCISALFFGLLIAFSHSIIPKPIGIYAIFGPMITLVLNAIPTPFPGALLEWYLLFSILIWIIPAGIFIMNRGGSAIK